MSTPQAQRANGAAGSRIQGRAGRFTVIAQNFHPTTTADDIEVAMFEDRPRPETGLLNCRLIETDPVTAELVFETEEQAKGVIDAFNNRIADGRMLRVYMQMNIVGAGAGRNASTQAEENTTEAALASLRHEAAPAIVVDGTLGFTDDGNLVSSAEASAQANNTTLAAAATSSFIAFAAPDKSWDASILAPLLRRKQMWVEAHQLAYANLYHKLDYVKDVGKRYAKLRPDICLVRLENERHPYSSSMLIP
jgi:hypothetical protein